MTNENKAELLLRLNNVSEQLNAQILEVQSVVAAIRKQLGDMDVIMSQSEPVTLSEVTIEVPALVSNTNVTDKMPGVAVVDGNVPISISPRQLRLQQRAVELERQKNEQKITRRALAQKKQDLTPAEPMLLGEPLELSNPISTKAKPTPKQKNPVSKKTVKSLDLGAPIVGKKRTKKA